MMEPLMAGLPRYINAVTTPKSHYLSMLILAICALETNLR